MKQTIRLGIWETNSSSVHSLCICSKDDFEKWKNGKLYYDVSDDKITDKETNRWGEDNYSYNHFWDDYCEYYEGFEEYYISPHGDEIIAFGYYGTEY